MSLDKFAFKNGDIIRERKIGPMFTDGNPITVDFSNEKLFGMSGDLAWYKSSNSIVLNDNNFELIGNIATNNKIKKDTYTAAEVIELISKFADKVDRLYWPYSDDNNSVACDFKDEWIEENL